MNDPEVKANSEAKSRLERKFYRTLILVYTNKHTQRQLLDIVL